MPGGGHGCYIVKHMAFRLFHRSKIGNHPGRLHHHLAQQKDTGAHDLTDHPHHPDNIMYLGKIPTGGSQLLPDIRNRIYPDNIHPVIGQVQKVIHHCIEKSVPGSFDSILRQSPGTGRRQTEGFLYPGGDYLYRAKLSSSHYRRGYRNLL